ncbi:MAG TPA: rhodanese-like domain-containing protein [Geminicoccaceae bacterium]|nr:rhodanese-like domain-containing protein [Geminicoccaceae bacterium]
MRAEDGTAPPRRDGPPLEIGPRELAGWRAAGVPHAILDVREPWEVAVCGFEDAIGLPLRDLADGEAGLPRDRPLVVLCHHGRRSLLATAHLRRRGFANAVNLAGGIDGWAAAVDPGMARY